MTAKTGEVAEKTGDFHCSTCGETVHVTSGDKIPPCPCGKNEFDSRTGEPGNKS